MGPSLWPEAWSTEWPSLYLKPTDWSERLANLSLYTDWKTSGTLCLKTRNGCWAGKSSGSLLTDKGVWGKLSCVGTTTSSVFPGPLSKLKLIMEKQQHLETVGSQQLGPGVTPSCALWFDSSFPHPQAHRISPFPSSSSSLTAYTVLWSPAAALGLLPSAPESSTSLAGLMLSFFF
jgi:hypothetical protein